MNYIVLDLEWNQSPEGKQFKDENLPFEIIEIGAVKLDSDMNIIGRFSQVIRPKVYKQIHYKTKEVINLDIEDLINGKDFVEVISSFFAWCGNNYMFATWGAMDLTEFQRNINYYNIENTFVYPLKYYDIQKLFSLYYLNSNVRKTLEYSVEYLNIDKNEEFHTAVSDAHYTAQIMKKIKISFIIKNFSIDYYKCPNNRSEEIYFVRDEGIRFISKGFNSKEELMSDKKVVSTKCYKCGTLIKKKIKWFSYNPKTYYCLCWCKEHGYIKGKIKVKKTDDGRYFALKSLKYISDEKTEEFRKILEEQKVKKKDKRREKVILRNKNDLLKE